MDIPEEIIISLDKIGTKEKRSRASIIRDAVIIYLSKKSETPEESNAFGIWKKQMKDGLEYQSKLRSEWE